MKNNYYDAQELYEEETLQAKIRAQADVDEKEGSTPEKKYPVYVETRMPYISKKVKQEAALRRMNDGLTEQREILEKITIKALKETIEGFEVFGKDWSAKWRLGFFDHYVLIVFQGDEREGTHLAHLIDVLKFKYDRLLLTKRQFKNLVSDYINESC